MNKKAFEIIERIAEDNAMTVTDVKDNQAIEVYYSPNTWMASEQYFNVSYSGKTADEQLRTFAVDLEQVYEGYDVDEETIILYKQSKFPIRQCLEEIENVDRALKDFNKKIDDAYEEFSR